MPRPVEPKRRVTSVWDMPGVAGVKIESLPKFAGDLMVRRRFVNKCNGNIYNSVVQGGGGPRVGASNPRPQHT